ncbi:MAG TPA: MBL fold metallo-hydrolase [Acidimicrobiia bacterium]|nr:MBL fold metallo-hydrolase [Acidimicrobiia bacterium]
MKVTLCGTRGSVGRAGGRTVRYGGDTSSVAVQGNDGDLLVLDAGSGITNVHDLIDPSTSRIDILLTHLHMDHIQGLGFFRPLFNPDIETHIWGPVSTTAGLAKRLSRYLSPPLFPVRLRDLNSLHLHDVLPPGAFSLPGFEVTADLVIHPGPTLGYRIDENGHSLAYLPDHEPALGSPDMNDSSRWLSGYGLIKGVEILIHDAQYTAEEYRIKVGWGHSTYDQCLALSRRGEVGTLVTFHHDPEHSDEELDRFHQEISEREQGVVIEPGLAGAVFTL